MSIVFSNKNYEATFRKRKVFLYVTTWTVYQYSATHLLTAAFLIIWWSLFFSIDFIYFQSDISTRYPLSFLLSSDISVTSSARSCLPKTCLIDIGRKGKKSLQIADVSFLRVVPITLRKWHCLKTDFRCSVFLAARVNVLPNQEESKDCLNRKLKMEDGEMNELSVMLCFPPPINEQFNTRNSQADWVTTLNIHFTLTFSGYG